MFGNLLPARKDWQCRHPQPCGNGLSFLLCEQEPPWAWVCLELLLLQQKQPLGIQQCILGLYLKKRIPGVRVTPRRSRHLGGHKLEEDLAPFPLGGSPGSFPRDMDV